MASIRLDGISKSFPGVAALKEITLQIQTGEFFTLLGPSGCGKTTLLRIVAGFHTQDAGSVYFGDRLMDAVPPYSRDTGMVFQNYAVFPHMTVYENVAFGLRNRRMATAEIARRVGRVLEMARLSGYEKRTPDQLSGGQQQRVGLARAMVIEPQVLLMDEPLSNLDAKLRVQMRSEIRDIQQELGITTIYVTHDQEEALVISDRIAVMNLGVVHQVGTAWEVYKRPADEFAASFVGHMNFIPAEVARREGRRVLVLAGSAAVLAEIPAVERLDEATREVSLAVRPEDLSIAPAEEAGNATISCVVEKSTFTGSLIQYGLSFGESRRLVVECHRPERDSIIPPGRHVTVRIPAEAIHLFDRSSGRRLGGEGGR